jgi:hypothetical protein
MSKSGAGHRDIDLTRRRLIFLALIAKAASAKAITDARIATDCAGVSPI